MSIINTPYKCPLEFFEIDEFGKYANDPVDACTSCKFYELPEEFNPQDHCRCPPKLKYKDYLPLQEEYLKNNNSPTLEKFWKFANEKSPSTKQPHPNPQEHSSQSL